MRRRVESDALLVRSVPYGESDVVATFFTEGAGKVSALVRGARRSTKRLEGGLEPMHVLAVTLTDGGGELMRLEGSRVARLHLALTANLEALEAAGRALRWVRHLCPARTPEPGVWQGLTHLLATLDAASDGGEEARATMERSLARFGFLLLSEVGYGLELDRCTRCDKPVPPGRAAMLDANAGGAVCSACGGGPLRLSARVRALASALARGEDADGTLAEARALVKLAEDVMAAHGGLDPSR